MRNLLLLLCISVSAFGTGSGQKMQRGWDALVRDNDTAAFRYFLEAREEALAERDANTAATAMLHLGICTYGVSLSQGLQYCMTAMEEFDRMRTSEPEHAQLGRSKCLQLVSTISGRQGKWKDVIRYSREAMAGLPASGDTSGYLGLIYSSLGEAYLRLGNTDSGAFYIRRALQELLLIRHTAYLPGAYIKVAELELQANQAASAKSMLDQALAIAEQTGNRQAQVSAWNGLAGWYLKSASDDAAAERCLNTALEIAGGLSDRSFYRKTLEQLMLLRKHQGKPEEALRYSEQLRLLQDSLASWERDRITKGLEVRFALSEKDRQLAMIRSEKERAALINYILWGTLLVIVMVAGGAILLLRKINHRDKQLLMAREQLMASMQEQELLKQQQIRNELEFRESQLSALTLQMVQKNELLAELRDKLEQQGHTDRDDPLNRIISKGMNQDKDWSDFNASFESMNRNFYARIREAYPDISPNDLKICALIKMNLSIKEMAAILNISPDSVKTARYRLRKKLQLQTEDNLTDFILHLQ